MTSVNRLNRMIFGQPPSFQVFSSMTLLHRALTGIGPPYLFCTVSVMIISPHKQRSPRTKDKATPIRYTTLRYGEIQTFRATGDRNEIRRCWFLNDYKHCWFRSLSTPLMKVDERLLLISLRCSREFGPSCSVAM
jgi:hypothetical protein